MGKIKKKTILFVGNFYLDDKKNLGLRNIGAKIINEFKDDNFDTQFVLFYKNPIMRMLYLTYKLFTTSFDILHLEVYSGRYFNFIASYVIVLTKIFKKKIFLNIAGGAMPEFHQKVGNRVIRILSLADVKVSPSKRIINHFSGSLDITYLPNFINFEKFPYKYSENNDNKLLWVRAFDSTYNPELPIYAVSELLKRNQNINLTMIGPDSGGLLKKCKSLVKELNLRNNIKILGAKSNLELYKYYNSHSIFLNTTSVESFGFGLVEAASCGIPIISSKVGEIKYIWEEDKEILFFDDKNLNGLVNQIEYLINNKDKHLSLSINAKKKSDIFSWESFSRHFYKINNGLLNTGKQ